MAKSKLSKNDKDKMISLKKKIEEKDKIADTISQKISDMEDDRRKVENDMYKKLDKIDRILDSEYMKIEDIEDDIYELENKIDDIREKVKICSECGQQIRLTERL